MQLRDGLPAALATHPSEQFGYANLLKSLLNLVVASLASLAKHLAGEAVAALCGISGRGAAILSHRAGPDKKTSLYSLPEDIQI